MPRLRKPAPKRHARTRGRDSSILLRERPTANEGRRTLDSRPLLGYLHFLPLRFLCYEELHSTSGPGRQPRASDPQDPAGAPPPASASVSAPHLCACATGKFAKVPEAKAVVSGSRQPPQPSDWCLQRTVLRLPAFGPDWYRWGKTWPCCATTGAAASASIPRSIPTVREKRRQPSLPSPPPIGGRPWARPGPGVLSRAVAALPRVRLPPGRPRLPWEPPAASLVRGAPGAGAGNGVCRRRNPLGRPPRGHTCFPAVLSPSNSPGMEYLRIPTRSLWGSRRQPGATGLARRLICSEVDLL